MEGLITPPEGPTPPTVYARVHAQQEGMHPLRGDTGSILPLSLCCCVYTLTCNTLEPSEWRDPGYPPDPPAADGLRHCECLQQATVVLLVCVCIHTWCACSASLHCTTTYTPRVHSVSVCMHSSRHCSTTLCCCVNTTTTCCMRSYC